MSSYVFPGYPAFLEAAAADSGRPESAGPARRIAALTNLANLCAQAAHGDPAHGPAILAEATGFRDQLATALHASEMMLAAVEAALAASEPVLEAGAEGPPEPTTPAPTSREANRTHRESS